MSQYRVVPLSVQQVLSPAAASRAACGECVSADICVHVQWTPLLKTYCIMSETNAVSTLFLSAFFWTFLAGEPVSLSPFALCLR